MTLPLKIKLSSTALGKGACSLNFYRTVVQGYREPAIPARLVYGIAVHKFIDTAFKSKGDIKLALTKCEEAFALPKIDDPRSMHLSDLRHLKGVCLNLWMNYIADDSTFELLEVGGVPLTEQTFAIPFYKDDYIDVDLCGTLDKIGKFKGGCYAVGDWKTTSSWDNKGYFQQFELSRQLLLYLLALKMMHEIAPNSSIGQIGANKTGAFIDAIFLKPDMNETLVKRSIVYQKSDEELALFKKSVLTWCINFSIKIQHHVNVFEPLQKEGIVTGSCEGKWGKCSFWNCCANSDKVAELLLKRDFKQTDWNPANYNDL